MTLGEKIISLRKARGMSQEDLAVTLNVSRQAVSKWETGEATPDTDKIIALAVYFETTTDWLLRNIELAPAAPISPTFPNFASMERGAPMVLCVHLGISALGLAMLLHGKFVSASNWPTLVGLSLQILMAALAVGYGLLLQRERPSVGHTFLRRFWRINVWLVAPLPLLLSARLVLSALPFSLYETLYAQLPHVLRPFASGALLAVPFLCYVLFCLVVTYLLRPKRP